MRHILFKIIAGGLMGLLSAQAAQATDVEKLYGGMTAFHQGDYADAVRRLSLPEVRNDPQAQEMLAVLYYEGTRVPQDYAKAALLWRLAAMQGRPSAQSALGHMYFMGYGVPQDDAQFAEWTTAAAREDDPIGLLNMAEGYETGRGFAQSDEYACMYYGRANAFDPDLLIHEKLADYWIAGTCGDYTESAVPLYQKARFLGSTTAQAKLDRLGARGYDISGDASICDRAKQALGFGPFTGNTSENFKGRLFLATGIATGDACSEQVAAFKMLYGLNGYTPDPLQAVKHAQSAADKGYKPAKPILADALRVQDMMTAMLGDMDEFLADSDSLIEETEKEIEAYKRLLE